MFARSVLVGALATAIDLAALTLLISGLGLRPELANVPALVLGVAVQFFGNKLFAFRDGSSAWVRQSTGFFVVELGALALNALAFQLLVQVLPFALARIVGSFGVYVAFSFPLWSRIFRTPESGAPVL